MNIPLFSLSGQIRLGRRSMLITENYFVRSEWQNMGAYSLGIRFGRKVTFDLGLGVVQDDYGDVYPIPVVELRAPFR